MPISNTVKAKGLYTFSNELDKPEGALVKADNVNIDEPGVITPRRGFKDIGGPLPSIVDRARQILQYKKTPIRQYDDILQFERDGEFYSFEGSYVSPDPDIRIKYQEANSNLYFTTNDGIKKISAKSARDFSQAPGYIKSAGVTKALDIEGKVEYVERGGFLPPESKVGYKILYGYKDVNNNLILGAPSSRFVVTNSSRGIYVYEKSNFTFKEDENFLAQKTVITCSAGSTIPNDGSSALYIHSANDEHKYILQITKGDDPEIIDPKYTTIQCKVLQGDNASTILNKILPLVEDLEGVTITSSSATQLLIKNKKSGESTGVITKQEYDGNSVDFASDMGNGNSSSGWVRSVDEVGTNSNYIGKYIIIGASEASYCLYWGDPDTINKPPTDAEVLGKIMIPVSISHTATKESIAVDSANAIKSVISSMEVSTSSGTGIYILTVTDTVGGDIPDASIDQRLIDNDIMELDIISQGSITGAKRANVKLNFKIPQSIDETYFYQIYRTAFIETTSGIHINDLDPGEEHFLIYEKPVEIGPNREIEYIDDVPELFRQQGTPLYNNPISGQGILQTNDVPPTAKDILTYKNYTFYANTTTYHRYNLTIFSVDDFVSGETKLRIGNHEQIDEYLFTGYPKATVIKTGKRQDTTVTTINNKSYINLYTARDLVHYIIWFDDGTGEEPTHSTEAITVRVDISGLDGNDNVGEKLFSTLSLLSAEFEVFINSNENEVTIITMENGDTTDTSSGEVNDPDTEIGTGWEILQGLPRITKLTTPTVDDIIESDGNNDAYFYLYSGEDVKTYVVWFDKGTGVAPTELDPSYTYLKVDLSGYTGTDNIDIPLTQAINSTTDFTASNDDLGEVIITSVVRAWSTSPHTKENSETDLGVGFKIEVDQIGRGNEVIGSNDVLINGSASAGINIDSTARNLVNKINERTNGIVNAYYLSGANDLPGKILIEAKTVGNFEFYMSIEGASEDSFNPPIPVAQSGFEAISQDDDETILTKTGHGLLSGEEIYLNIPNANPAIIGIYEIQAVDVDNIKIKIKTFNDSNVNGSYYFHPFEVSDNLKSPNRIYYSKLGQPEAVPMLNYVDIGTRDEPIERILALRDNLFVLKTDGIFMLSGYEAPFTVRFLDTEKIASPDSAVVLNNQIFMLSTSNVISINESSPSIVSRMIENEFDIILNKGYPYRRVSFGVGYEDDKAYLLWVPTIQEDTVATQCFRYNILERTWTRWTKTATCGAIVGESPRLYIGDGDRNYTMVERKDRSRTDYADRDFSLFIPSDAIVNDMLRLSDVSNVEVGDVLTQEQYLTPSFFNRFLIKLDNDTKLSYNEYEKEFKCHEGDDLASKLNALNIKLRDDEGTGAINIYLYSNSDFKEMQNQFNKMIDDMNQIGVNLSFNTYKYSKGKTVYEYIITEKFRFQNQVKLYKETSLIQGEVQIYKAIDNVVQYNPIHFGNPSSFKQVNMGYMMFDQNNFFKATVQHASDLSPSFEGLEFSGKGTGYWDYSDWSNQDINYWGGSGNDAPRRVIIPRNKQRCRYISVKFLHKVAREYFRLTGVAHNVREVSPRAYK